MGETRANDWPAVVVVGPGGVGAYFGGMLARAGAGVTMLGRPTGLSAHLKAMAGRGLRLNTVTFDERVPVRVAADSAAVASAGLVLFCVKSTDTDDAAAQIAPHLREEAIVVDLQNGVDNPERLRRAGIDPVPAVVYVAAAVEAPGEVTHRGRGDLVIGHPSRPETVERAAGWLERAGIPCRVVADIDYELWIKLILNSMANATSALTRASYERLSRFEPTWRVAIDVASEAVAVARRLGHAIDLDEVIERGRQVTRAVGEATSSTEQDLSRGRPTEIDALNGYIAQRGEELEVPTPVNRVLWALVKLAERDRRGR